MHKCANCENRPINVVFKTCGRCNNASYCCKECQVAHWKVHKPMCYDCKDSEYIDFRNAIDNLRDKFGYSTPEVMQIIQMSKGHIAVLELKDLNLDKLSLNYVDKNSFIGSPISITIEHKYARSINDIKDNKCVILLVKYKQFNEVHSLGIVADKK